MDLIYYYPWRTGTPAMVAKNVFKHLQKRRKELPFEKIMLFTSSKSAKDVQKPLSDIEIITYRNLSDVSKDCVVHIPLSPHIMPNSKFLLHLFTVLKRKLLILQYHGDIRIEMRLKFKYVHSLDIASIPSYIAMPYLLRSADELIVNSYLMSRLVRIKYGVKNDVVISNGIDDFWFDETDKMSIDLDGDPTIFYHGRLSSEKGVNLLLKGFAKAIGEYSKAKLYIAGDGPQREHLKKLCVKLGIKKNVVVLGFIKQLKSSLHSVDAAIYPSIYEPFSIAILEAFSSVNGPVYYSSFAGINDFVTRDGYNLNVFDPTIENISKIINDVIDENYDTRIVKQQKEFSRQYTWDKIINNYIELYNQMYTLI